MKLGYFTLKKKPLKTLNKILNSAILLISQINELWETKCDFFFSKPHFLDILDIQKPKQLKNMPKPSIRSPMVLKTVALKNPKKP